MMKPVGDTMPATGGNITRIDCLNRPGSSGWDTINWHVVFGSAGSYGISALSNNLKPYPWGSTLTVFGNNAARSFAELKSLMAANDSVNDDAVLGWFRYAF